MSFSLFSPKKYLFDYDTLLRVISLDNNVTETTQKR